MVSAGGGGTEQNGSSGGPTTPGTTIDYAVAVSKFPEPWGDGDGNGWQGDDPNTLVLTWQNSGSVCGMAMPFPPNETTWGVALAIPPDLVKVGPVMLADSRIWWRTFYQVVPRPPPCDHPPTTAAPCGFVGFSGPYIDDSFGGAATSSLDMFEIVSIDATSITVNLVTGLTFYAGATVEGVAYQPLRLQGMYTLPRC
jgi:hypothetical protein